MEKPALYSTYVNAEVSCFKNVPGLRADNQHLQNKNCSPAKCNYQFWNMNRATKSK